MSVYTAPVRDMTFLLYEIAGLPSIVAIPTYSECSEDLVAAILEASASFAEGVLTPLNPVGDRHGVKVEAGNVTTAPGFADAYRQYIDNGWPSLPIPCALGGQGLPDLVNTAVMEMVMSANLAFSFCPMLTQGALKTIEAHGSEAVKAMFLKKMVSGEWTGAMDLTEPQAGSDLSTVKTRAVPDGDAYRIRGQKIFISWGDHDIADNIVHLVLARLPDAPEGTRGISLFAVPKFLVNPDGSLGGRNDIHTLSVEEKLGQHGSPTCVLAYGDNGGAIGYLLGRPHKGLACMFTMMNHARINVGLQGLGLAERAYQQGAAYAGERVQGGQPIVRYPDVERMVMLMRSGCAAMRAMIYTAMGLADMADSDNSSVAGASNRRLQLITPVVKAWCTDLTQEITSLNIQIHGGMGFVEETGAAQYYRDARILPIYEGTNAIQANDLIGRKILADNGEELRRLFAEMAADQGCFNDLPAPLPALTQAIDTQQQSLTDAGRCADLIMKASDSGNDWRPVACYFLDLLGYVVGAWLLQKKMVLARQKQDLYGADFAQTQLENYIFYCDHYLPRTHCLSAIIERVLK